MQRSALRQRLKAYVSENILNSHCLSLNDNLCIHFYWLSWQRQASHRKMIQSSTLRLRRFKILTCPLLKTSLMKITNVIRNKVGLTPSYILSSSADFVLDSLQLVLHQSIEPPIFQPSWISTYFALFAPP